MEAVVGLGFWAPPAGSPNECRIVSRRRTSYLGDNMDLNSMSRRTVRYLVFPQSKRIWGAAN